MHVISFALLLLAAVPSLQPYYAPGDKILDPNLVGVWRAKGSTWQITPSPERTDYELAIDEGDGGVYTATLFQIDNNRFLDLKPKSSEMIDDEFLALNMIPAHTLFRVWMGADSLRIAPMDGERLAVMLTQQPSLAANVTVERAGAKPLLVLTGSTAQLKGVVGKNLDKLFVQPMSLVRDASAPIPPVPMSGGDRGTTETVERIYGMPLNSAQVAILAARYANDETEKQFGKRPFRPIDWPAKWENGKWNWGRMEYTGKSGYSAEVTMNRDGSEVNVKIYRTAPDQQLLPGTVPEVRKGPRQAPPAPIVPKY
ncbi:MAG: hypothetical protein ABFD69_15320 [Candidatus Sumerlaeia bacterium]